MRGRHVALVFLLIGASFAAGTILERNGIAGLPEAETGPRILYWVAPMDPNFRRDGPGKSPMGMDLVPVYEGEEPGGDPGVVRLGPAEINAIGVRTAVARVEPVSKRIETVGFVRYDDHATSHIHTRVDGWIEALRVRAIGEPVTEGDLLFELYAPEITIASSELMRASRRGDAQEVEIARRKLRNFGVSPAQIDEMAAASEPARNIRVYAPQDGVVIALEAADGMFLKPETRAMSLTDLSSVWVLVDVFERDIARLDADMTAEARFEHLPGRILKGTVDYVYPELDPDTRTLPVRLRFDNSEGLLRPNMYGSVTLVPRSSREALTVPSEAVIRTGRAERVILRTGEGTFRPRLVTTGLTDSFGEGGRTEIVQGLAPGEVVVASAQFLIDSESALSAGLMRFAPTEAAPAHGRGEIVVLDADRRVVEIAHEPIAALDWPALTTRFVVEAHVDLGWVAEGDLVGFAIVRGADGQLALTAVDPDEGIEATGSGVVEAVTPDGRLAMRHEPIPALGWPAMAMDMPVEGLDPATVPTGVPVSFDLGRKDDGTFVIVGVRAGDEAREGSGEDPRDAPPAPPVMTADGRVNAVNAAARTANVSHGPLAEIGMPGMTMNFPLGDALDPAAIGRGPARLSFSNDPDRGLLLVRVEASGPPLTARGTVNSVDAAAGTANITHGPLAGIGMPGMTMDFPLGPGLDPAAIPLGETLTVVFEQSADMSLSLVAIEDKAGAAGEGVQ